MISLQLRSDPDPARALKSQKDLYICTARVRGFIISGLAKRDSARALREEEEQAERGRVGEKRSSGALAVYPQHPSFFPVGCANCTGWLAGSAAVQHGATRLTNSKAQR